MKTDRGSPEQRAHVEQERLTAAAMLLLTGGLTAEGDTFLIAAGAILLTSCLYRLTGGWAFFTFPLVFIGAALARARRRRSRRAGRSREIQGR